MIRCTCSWLHPSYQVLGVHHGYDAESYHQWGKQHGDQAAVLLDEQERIGLTLQKVTTFFSWGHTNQTMMVGSTTKIPKRTNVSPNFILSTFYLLYNVFIVLFWARSYIWRNRRLKGDIESVVFISFLHIYPNISGLVSCMFVRWAFSAWLLSCQKWRWACSGALLPCK